MLRIGIDLGGTKTEAIALNADGQELRRLRVGTPKDDYPGTIATICKLVRDVEADLGETGTVGVGIPGTIVAATGLVKNANSVWLNGQPLGHDLSAALQREVRCANDANCFTVSEATDGAATGFNVVFGVILGTGCGGGVVIGGELHAGPNGVAGEWGHMPLPWATADELPGPPCYCGRSGCVETWISGTGFERDFAEHTGKPIRGGEIVQRMRTGDPMAGEQFRKLMDRIARSMAVIVNVLDPDAIVVGGGLSNVPELFSGELEAAIANYTFGGRTTTPVRKNLHGDSSGVRGAAWLWPLASRRTLA